MFRHDQTSFEIPDLKKLITRNPTNMWYEIPTKSCTIHAENSLEKTRQSLQRPAEKCLEETGQTCKL
jgi:hypothetical protein